MYKLIFGVLIIIFLGCSDSTINPNSNQIGLEYFPMQVGDFKIYDIEETNFSVLGSETSIYQLKESVADSFLNIENQFSYIINRETRINDTHEWVLDSVWTARVTNQYAVLVENNRSIMKLVFPIEHGLQWDGNALNSKSEKIFTYNLNIGDTILMENQFSNLSKIIQSDIEENLINRNESFEIYAKDVGLIIKNSIILEYCQTDCPETKTVDSGRIYKATLSVYGKE